MSIIEYLETINAGRFAHTCHKTDNRLACDGPRNFKGESPEHCAGALHFMIRAGLDCQLPILHAMEDGRLDYDRAKQDAEKSNVFASVKELIRYYVPVIRQALVDRRADPLVCVVFPENPTDPPTMLKLSVVKEQGLETLPCCKCDQPATSYDTHWPYHQDRNYCDQHGDREEKSMSQTLADLDAELDRLEGANA